MVLLLAAGCSEATIPGGPHPDAPSGTAPDSPSGTAPDSPVAGPDARPGGPDAPSGGPDAKLGTPDAKVATPDAKLATPDAPPGAPDAPSGSPDAGTTMTNVGWIGGSCSGTGDCQYAGAMCLVDGFPNGMCSLECTGICPDRGHPTDSITFCVDGRPFGFDEGICVSRCDTDLLPPTGCAPGYRCLPKGRYLDSGTVINVCVPDVPEGPCPDGVDEIVPLAYPQAGSVWIPAEAQCGGNFPLVVLLHGINPSKNPTPSLGGGRHLEYLVRSLIDAGLIEPVVLAEPVQDDDASASSSTLYDAAEWTPTTHLTKVKAILDPRGIGVTSLSYTGHSGAGCADGNGLYQVLDRFDDLIPTFAPEMRMWGLMDICYIGTYHYQEPIDTLTGAGTVIFNMWTVQDDPTSFEEGLIPDPADIALCPDSIYTKCIHHKTEPWCSYRTNASAGITHDDNPAFFVREAFPQVFSTDAQIQPCR